MLGGALPERMIGVMVLPNFASIQSYFNHGHEAQDIEFEGDSLNCSSCMDKHWHSVKYGPSLKSRRSPVGSPHLTRQKVSRKGTRRCLGSG